MPHKRRGIACSSYFITITIIPISCHFVISPLCPSSRGGLAASLLRHNVRHPSTSLFVIPASLFRHPGLRPGIQRGQDVRGVFWGGGGRRRPGLRTRPLKLKYCEFRTRKLFKLIRRSFFCSEASCAKKIWKMFRPFHIELIYSLSNADSTVGPDFSPEKSGKS